METLNSLSSSSNYKVSSEDLKTLIKLLAPLAPYVAEELCSLFEKTSIHMSQWPIAEETYLVEDEVTVMVAINGKVRSQLRVKSNETDNKELVLKLARENKDIIKWVGTSDIVKEIYIPSKMVNLVVKI
jgi:leucyl-tRNA synthetase